MMKQFGRLAAASAVLALVAGCAVGPDFLKPSAPDVKGYTPEPLPSQTGSARVHGGEAQRFVQDMDIPGQWWSLFRSPQLNELVERSLKANPDLEAAKAALRAAQENVAAEKGSFFPKVDGSASVERERTSGAGFGIPGAASIFGVSTAALNISYPLDIFGGTRRQVESLQAQELYQRFQVEAAYLTLSSNVVATAIQEASLRAQIAATEDIIKIESQDLDVLQSQLQLGGIAKSSVLQQAANLAQEKATLPPLQKQLAQARDRLRTYAGQLPSQDIAQTFNLDAIQLPMELPVSLPSRLVEQRPDVQAAMAQLHEASAQIGVATANQLPQFSLTGSFGSTASPITNLFSPGTGVWSIGANVAQTIFDGGTLLHKKRATVALFEQSAAQYRSTVLTAFQNVADALRALQADADALAAQVQAERAAAESLDLARQQFRLGAITFLTLLTSEQTYQQTRISLVVAQANRYADTAALFQALGGGWWNRADVAAQGDGKHP